MDYNTKKAVNALEKFKEHWCRVDGRGSYPCDCPFEDGRICRLNQFIRENSEDGEKTKIPWFERG